MPTEEELEQMSPEELAAYQKANCLFCKIIAKEVQSKIVYEDESVLCILDINPAAPGHVLVIPKEHYALLPQIPEEVMAKLFLVAQHVSNAMLRALDTQGTTLFLANGAVAGQRSPHFLFHVIPRSENDNILPVPDKQLPDAQAQEFKRVLPALLARTFGQPPPITEKKMPPPPPNTPAAPAPKPAAQLTDDSLDDIAGLFT
ncbi:MAG: HIT domain-containing protein [archaeon]